MVPRETVRMKFISKEGGGAYYLLNGHQRRSDHDEGAMFHVKRCEGGLYRRRDTMVLDPMVMEMLEYRILSDQMAGFHVKHRRVVSFGAEQSRDCIWT